MQAFVGTSGWTYNHWRGPFYPYVGPSTRWLEFYAERFNTVELNATFYRPIREQTFMNWYARTPPGFVWSVKISRYITHTRRLLDAQEPFERFISALSPLREKLGPILIQLPPSLGFDQPRFEAFGRILPKGMQFTIEARHPAWLTDEALAALRDHHIAWCISDTAGRYPYREAVTADFIYIRLHGSQSLYASDYTEPELHAWSEKIRAWNQDTYVYFDNDYQAYAPANALRLRELLQSPH